MDSHFPNHIAHSIFWKKGPNHPHIKINQKSFNDVLYTPKFDKKNTKPPNSRAVKLAPIDTMLSSDDKLSNGKRPTSKSAERKTSRQLLEAQNGYGDNEASFANGKSSILKRAESKRQFFGVHPRDLETKDENAYSHEPEIVYHPDPFTVITYLDVLNEVWVPVSFQMRDWCLHYTKELEKQSM